jgi:hypothetical protein
MQGECLCGAVSFRLTNPKPSLYQCHCSLCRKQGGAASNAATIVGPAGFTWIKGQNSISKYALSSGFSSHFCRICGSPVPNPLRDSPYIWVPAGLLGSKQVLTVVAHIYVGSKASWDVIPSNVKQYKTMPKLAEFVKILHSQQV